MRLAPELQAREAPEQHQAMLRRGPMVRMVLAAEVGEALQAAAGFRAAPAATAVPEPIGTRLTVLAEAAVAAGLAGVRVAKVATGVFMAVAAERISLPA